MEILKYQYLEYTQDQQRFLSFVEGELKSFKEKPNNTKELRISGFAGTGKTTCIYNIVKYIQQHCNIFNEVIVLAPTNKAKLVLQSKMSLKSDYFSTIHRYIYGNPDDDDALSWTVKSEKSKIAVIIDESSMISKEIYEDIRSCFVESFIILIGDGYQLEPVGSDAKLLTKPDLTLTEVKRNAGDILNYSVKLRTEKKLSLPIEFDSIKIINNFQSIDYCVELLKNNVDVVYITATNKHRVNCNLKIKRRLNSEELSLNDTLISITNCNTFVNGEVFNVSSLNIEKKLNIEIKTQYKTIKESVTVAIINNKKTLCFPTTEESSLGHYILNKLDYEVLLDLVGENFIEWDESGRFPQISKEVVICTYGYAISCHKSQGSQWNTVIVDQNWVSDGKFGWDNVRWLYTAVTRAEKHLILVK